MKILFLKCFRYFIRINKTSHWTIPTHDLKPSTKQKQLRQFAPSPDESELLKKKETTQVQRVVGGFLYYTRAIDNTVIVTSNEIASMQARPTLKSTEKINMLLNYLATHPNVRIQFYSSNMI